jgi:hypothetical protein
LNAERRTLNVERWFSLANVYAWKKIVRLKWPRERTMKENLATKDGLVQKLQALQNMTVANGCTESEALVAAGKAAELLERYGLSMEELKAAAPNQLCDQNSINCGRPRYTHEVQFLAPVIAEFTKTKTWLSRTSTEVQMTFFGLKADVQIASCLFNVFRAAMEHEWTLFWVCHAVEQNVNRRTARRSFMLGMAKRIQARLFELMDAAESGPVLSASREIVVLKEQIVEKALRDLNLRFRRTSRSKSTTFDVDAFVAGQVAGNNVSISSGELKDHP